MKYSSSNTSKPSSWWQDLKAVSFVEGGGGWFDTNLKRRVGRGNDVRFWEEVWHNEYLLKDKYPRLYLMSTKANKSIEEMGVWRDGTWTWEFGWRRSLRDHAPPNLPLLPRFRFRFRFLFLLVLGRR